LSFVGRPLAFSAPLGAQRSRQDTSSVAAVARAAASRRGDGALEKSVDPSDPYTFVFKGKRVEVRAPSQRWREAQVVNVSSTVAVVHYIGYDHQYDETIELSSDRLRPFGELHAANLVNAKNSFVHQNSKGFCPGCGAALQDTNPAQLGYIPRALVEDEDADLRDTVLRPDEEVALLLKEEGAKEMSTPSDPTRVKQMRYRVIANVHLDIRKEPDIDAERVEGQFLSIGDRFDVVEVVQSPEARMYLRLADGRGWVFDWAMIGGVRTFLVEPLQDGRDVIKAMKNSYQKVCQRCWALWQYNSCDDAFRPSYGGNAIDELTPDKFEEMLTSTLEPVDTACILAVVDVFDFGPSFRMLEYLAQQLKGKKAVRVRVIANKMDLLPREVSIARIKGWVSREAQRAGLMGVKLMDVFPVSCHNGDGVKSIGKLLDQVDAAPEFYVVGAANAGKSSLLNRLSFRKRKGIGVIPAHTQDGYSVSVLPGTTIRPLVMKYQQGKRRLVDTPGLLLPGSLHERLSFEELKLIIPQKNGALRVTLEMRNYNSLLLGGLAQVSMVEGRPFQFTVFAGEKLKMHRCNTREAEAYLRNEVGRRLTPPLRNERYEELKPFETHRFEVEGAGWDEAGADIVIHGLGWIAITGCGQCVVEVKAPDGVAVTTRRPLMPHEAKWTGVKYIGRPGWFRVNGRSTKGMSLAKKRRRIKGRF